MKIAIVSDAWTPQINGVVTTLRRTGEWLERAGHQVRFITPQGFRTVPCPSYPEIRLVLRPRRKLSAILDTFNSDAIHIATEGPLGFAARAYCRAAGHPFTTSYHTQFPEFVRLRAPVPLSLTYAWLRRFHHGAKCTLVGTESQRRTLLARGFSRLKIWPRGVDPKLFRPRDKLFLDGPRPIAMYVGRVAVEKNIEAFLDLDLPGIKYVVGDGPALARLRVKYPNVRFTGYKVGAELARHLAAADVFVFPSRTDTFGLVLLEAMACGVPVAAYPVTGPIDVVQNGVTGILHNDLRRATLTAMELDGNRCRDYALTHTWQAATQRFLELLVSSN